MIGCYTEYSYKLLKMGWVTWTKLLKRRSKRWTKWQTHQCTTRGRTLRRLATHALTCWLTLDSPINVSRDTNPSRDAVSANWWNAVVRECHGVAADCKCSINWKKKPVVYMFCHYVYNYIETSEQYDIFTLHINTSSIWFTYFLLYIWLMIV